MRMCVPTRSGDTYWSCLEASQAIMPTLRISQPHADWRFGSTGSCSLKITQSPVGPSSGTTSRLSASVTSSDADCDHSFFLPRSRTRFTFWLLANARRFKVVCIFSEGGRRRFALCGRSTVGVSSPCIPPLSTAHIFGIRPFQSHDTEHPPSVCSLGAHSTRRGGWVGKDRRMHIDPPPPTPYMCMGVLEG